MPNNYTTIAVCSPGWEFDVEDFNERHAKTCLCSVVRPMPEQIEQIPSRSYPDGTTERQRIGAGTDWYEWAIENWGTKSGTYGLCAFGLGGDHLPVAIKFQSAWRAPKILEPIAGWLSKTFRFERVAYIGFDPYDCSTSMLGEFKFKQEDGE